MQNTILSSILYQKTEAIIYLTLVKVSISGTEIGLDVGSSEFCISYNDIVALAMIKIYINHLYITKPLA